MFLIENVGAIAAVKLLKIQQHNKERLKVSNPPWTLLEFHFQSYTLLY